MATTRIFVHLLFSFFCLALMSGCATQKAPELFARPTPAFEGTYNLMQRVLLSIPQLGVEQSFNAAVAVSMPDKSARVVALSGPGVTLFDVSVHGQDAMVHYMHPGFRRIPRVEEHVLWSVRLVVLNTLAVMPAPASGSPDTDNAVTHILSPEGRVVSAQETRQGKVAWVMENNGYEGIWPKTIHLKNVREGFSVQVATYSVQRES